MKSRGALEILQLEVHISLLDSQARNLAAMAEYVDDSSRQAEYRKAADEVRKVIVEYQDRIRSLTDDQ
jgi:hypothetical protein